MTGLGAAMLHELPSFPDTNGLLVVTAESPRPFPVQRVFTVHSDSGEVRGQHAHRECSQFLVCLSGSFRIMLHNGTETWEVSLDRPSIGLLIPPFIWASELSEADGSVLLVLCDREFDEAEYIRDFDDFLAVTLADLVE